MEEPRYILNNGTKVVTHLHCNGPVGATGILVKPYLLEARRPKAKGETCGIVPGHGGDVYWVRHEDGQVAAYGWWEFELDENDLPTG